MFTNNDKIDLNQCKKKLLEIMNNKLSTASQKAASLNEVLKDAFKYSKLSSNPLATAAAYMLMLNIYDLQTALYLNNNVIDHAATTYKQALSCCDQVENCIKQSKASTSEITLCMQSFNTEKYASAAVARTAIINKYSNSLVNGLKKQFPVIPQTFGNH